MEPAVQEELKDELDWRERNEALGRNEGVSSHSDDADSKNCAPKETSNLAADVPKSITNFSTTTFPMRFFRAALDIFREFLFGRVRSDVKVKKESTQ